MEIEELSAKQFEGIKSYFTYVFIENKAFYNRPIKMLQLGVFAGDASKWLLNNVEGALVDVDPWDTELIVNDYSDSPYGVVDMSYVEQLYSKNTDGLPVTKFKGTTKDFFNQNKDTFDFIYIDASHAKKDVYYDLEKSWKILNPGGIIACDDYLWGMHLDPELRPHDAINEFVEKKYDKIFIICKDYQYWFKKI